MCDFHSCIIRADGTLFHLPCNSHTVMGTKSGWAGNTSAHRQSYWEWEWNGQGPIPTNDGIRSQLTQPTLSVQLTAARHAKSLQKAMTTGVLDPVFKGKNFSDVRRRVARLQNCSKRGLNVRQVMALAQSGCNYRDLLAANKYLPYSTLLALRDKYWESPLIKACAAKKAPVIAKTTKRKPKAKRNILLTASGKRRHYSPAYGR